MPTPQEDFDSRLERVKARLIARGLQFREVSRKRTAEQQAKLFAQGRPGGPPGRIVTDKSGKPGDESLHQTDLARDFTFLNKPKGVDPWVELGRAAKAEGLGWGGDFKDLQDFGHVQATPTGPEARAQSAAAPQPPPSLEPPKPARPAPMKAQVVAEGPPKVSGGPAAPRPPVMAADGFTDPNSVRVTGGQPPPANRQAVGFPTPPMTDFSPQGPEQPPPPAPVVSTPGEVSEPEGFRPTSGPRHPRDFAAAVRRAHPDLAGVADDQALSHAVVRAYPDLAPYVMDPLQGSEDAKVPALPAGARPGAIPPPTMSMDDNAIATAGNLIAMPVTGTKRFLKGAEAAGSLLQRLPSEDSIGAGAPPMLGERAVTAQEIAQPFADVVGGGMEAATPLIVPALIAAPWVTLGALAVGTAVTEGTNYAATELGAPPGVAELAGDVAGLVGGGVAAHAINAPLARMKSTAATGARLDAMKAFDEGPIGSEINRRHQEYALQQDVANQAAEFAQVQDRQAAALADLHAKLAINEGLRILAQQYKSNRPNPFEYLDATTKMLPAGNPPPAPLELGPATGTEIAPTSRPGAPELTSPGIPPGTPPIVTSAGGQEFVNIEGRGRSAGPPVGPFIAAEGGGAGVEAVGSMAPKVATSMESQQPLMRQLGDQLQASLERPQGPPQVDLPAAVRSRLQDQEHYKSTYRQQLGRMRDEMDAVEYTPGMNVEYDTENGGRSSYYSPPSGWAQVYHDVIRGMLGAKDTAENGPGGKVIRAVLRMFAETDGKVDAAALTPQQMELGKKESGLDGPRAFRNAYNRWAPEAAKVAKKRAMRELARGTIEDRQTYSRLNDRELGRPSIDEIMRRNAELDAADAAAQGGPPTLESTGGESLDTAIPSEGSDTEIAPDASEPTTQGPVTPELGTPPVDISDSPEVVAARATAAADTSPVPDFGLDDVENPTLPGMESVRGTENPTPPVAEAPFALEPTTAKPAGGEPPSLFDALKETGSNLIKDTSGELKLTMAPGDETAMRKWLDSKRRQYGNESWFEAAEQAMEDGSPLDAWRIAAVASAQESYAARSAGGNEPKDQAARAAAQDRLNEAADAHRKLVETELGMKLPDTVSVSPEGILTFQPGGKGVPAIKASSTDLLLGNALLRDLTTEADASQIIRLHDQGANKAMQISSQIADQIVREMPDEAVHAIAELTGIDPKKATTAEQRLEVGRAYRRAYSFMGKALGELGRWTQENEDLFYQYAGVDETGAASEVGSVGALQAQGIKTGENFVQWLGGKAKESEIKNLGFELPKGIELKNDKGELTPEAKTFARNWFRRQTRRAEIQKTIDVIAKEGGVLDRAIVRSTISPNAPAESQSAISQAISLSKAALVSKTSTAVRNGITQSGRFGWGAMDDTMAGTFSYLTGDVKGGNKYMNEAWNLAQGVTRPGKNTLHALKNPWAEGLEAVYNYKADLVADMSARNMHKTLKVMQEFPSWESKFMGDMSLNEGMTGNPKVDAIRNVLTVQNRMQEHFFRMTVADAMFRSQLEEAGLNPAEVLKGDPKSLIEKLGEDVVDRMIGASVSASLDYTFAAEPIKDTVPDLLLNKVFRAPVLGEAAQLVQPFARFNFVSAPRWLWDHFPLAPITDLAEYQLSRARGDSSNILRGRYYFMRQAQKNADILLKLDGELGRQEYEAAKHLGDYTAANDIKRSAAREFKALEKKASGPNGMLPELQQPINDAMAQMKLAIETAHEAKSAWREAETRIKNLRDQRGKAVKSGMALKEAGVARSPQEYFAQKFTGGMAFVAAYLLRQSAGALATKWYEYQLPPDPGQPDDMKRIVDLRGYAPEVQSLFLADVAQDIQEHTDFSEITPEIMAGGPDVWSEYMRSHYTGKYTSSEFLKDALEAYLSVSPAAGSTRDLMAQFTGRAAQGEGVDLGTIQRAIVGTLGEFIGRYSAPLDAVSDVLGAAGSEEDTTARIPAQGGKEKKSVGRQLVDPFLANVPGANRSIPEKVNPFSGKPFKTESPGLHFFGVTTRTQNAVESEIKATGTPVGAAVPRQTGDREFDNMVNKAYSKLLEEYMPQVFANEQYQGLTPELKRDVLVNGVPGMPAIFPALKKAAYSVVAEQVGGEKATKELEGAGVKQKRERWMRYLDQLNQEAETASPEPASEPDQPAQVEPGAPPQF